MTSSAIVTTPIMPPTPSPSINPPTKFMTFSSMCRRHSRHQNEIAAVEDEVGDAAAFLALALLKHLVRLRHGLPRAAAQAREFLVDRMALAHLLGGPFGDLIEWMIKRHARLRMILSAAGNTDRPAVLPRRADWLLPIVY